MYKKGDHEIPIEEALVKNSTFTRSHLKTKILKYNLLPYKCAICGLGPEWNGNILTLQVDHINGDNKDHRIENLRFLCPNCHSQTENYAGGNAINRKRTGNYTCKKCGNYRSRVSVSGLCNHCRTTQDRFNWPDDQSLIKMIAENSIFAVSKKLGCSDPALRKRLRKKSLI
jgi:Zn finger protein HypA/HybF involved in hydrogenase expression